VLEPRRAKLSWLQDSPCESSEASVVVKASRCWQMLRNDDFYRADGDDFATADDIVVALASVQTLEIW